MGRIAEARPARGYASTSSKNGSVHLNEESLYRLIETQVPEHRVYLYVHPLRFNWDEGGLCYHNGHLMDDFVTIALVDGNKSSHVLGVCFSEEVA